jgi:hypothetical protein
VTFLLTPILTPVTGISGVQVVALPDPRSTRPARRQRRLDADYDQPAFFRVPSADGDLRRWNVLGRGLVKLRKTQGLPDGAYFCREPTGKPRRFLKSLLTHCHCTSQPTREKLGRRNDGAPKPQRLLTFLPLSPPQRQGRVRRNSAGVLLTQVRCEPDRVAANFPSRVGSARDKRFRRRDWLQKANIWHGTTSLG